MTERILGIYIRKCSLLMNSESLVTKVKQNHYYLIREGSPRGLGATQISQEGYRGYPKNLHICQLVYAIMKLFSSNYILLSFPKAPKVLKDSYQRLMRISKSI